MENILKTVSIVAFATVLLMGCTNKNSKSTTEVIPKAQTNEIKKENNPKKG